MAKKKIPKWLDDIGKAAKANGTSKLTAKEINAEIEAVRRQNRKKKAG